MTQAIDVASEQSTAPMPKMMAPAQNVARPPITAVTRPVQVAATMDEATNAVVGQCINAAPPSSPTIVGSTVASISTFIECSSTPPSRTASADSHSGLTSARQPLAVSWFPESSPFAMRADYA